MLNPHAWKPSKPRIIVHNICGSCPSVFPSAYAIHLVAVEYSDKKSSNSCHFHFFNPQHLHYHRYHRFFPLPVFGYKGNNLEFDFIFLINTRYASKASICVGNVLLRFIHIFRYLSEFLSFRATYHSPAGAEESCLRTMARRRPPRAVTLLACFRQAALRSDISVSSSTGASA